MLYCCGYKLDKIRPIFNTLQLLHFDNVFTIVNVQTTDEKCTCMSVYTIIHCTFVQGICT